MFLEEQSGQMLPVKDPQSQSECPPPKDSIGSANNEPTRQHAVQKETIQAVLEPSSGQKRLGSQNLKCLIGYIHTHKACEHLSQSI